MSSINSPSVLSLEEAAMMRIAKSIWDHRITHDDLANVNNLFKPFEISDSIPLPNILTNRLAKYLDALAKEIDYWMINHNSSIFHFEDHDDLLPHLKHLVWRMNGTIDYESTARALLEVESLSKSEKFNLATGYFFLDYITEKWPELSNDIVKTFIRPKTVLQIMLDASSHASIDQLIKMHKKLENLLNWYFTDCVGITSFKLAEIMPYWNTSQQARVGIVLHGSRYGAPITT